MHWVSAFSLIGTMLIATGCTGGGCIELLGILPVTELPHPDWATIPGKPNAVLDSLGPGRYMFTEKWSDGTFDAYRVSTKDGRIGYIIEDSLVRRCPQKP